MTGINMLLPWRIAKIWLIIYPLKEGLRLMDTNICQDAYDQIKYKIIHFHYLPGQKISEKMISTTLNLGRTPVREALIRIEREGLIEVVPQSGTYVTTINIDSVQNGRFVRECLEPNVMLDAMTKLTKEHIDNLNKNMEEQEEAAELTQTDRFFDLDQAFHGEFYEAAGKQEIWQWLQLNNTQLNRFRRLRLKVPGLNWATLLKQHEEIFSAIKWQDVDDLSYLMHAHLHLMLVEKETVMRYYPDYFSSNSEAWAIFLI